MKNIIIKAISDTWESFEKKVNYEQFKFTLSLWKWLNHELSDVEFKSILNTFVWMLPKIPTYTHMYDIVESKVFNKFNLWYFEKKELIHVFYFLWKKENIYNKYKILFS